MKRKIFSLTMVVALVFSMTNVFAATAWLQDNVSDTDGLVETEVLTEVINGTAELIVGNKITDANPLNFGEVQFRFDANPGYELSSSGKSFGANDPTQDGYYYSTEMRTLWPDSAAREQVSENLDQYYTLNTRIVEMSQTYLILGVRVDRSDVPFPDEVVFAHLEPELSATISVDFTLIPEENEYFYVRAESNPSGVASFSGTGETFMIEDSYNVTYTILDSDYYFTGWTGVPSGDIEGNVDLVANFEKKSTPISYYNVSAVSNPAGIATFTGTGNTFIYGSSYNVQYTQIVEGYVFTGWSTSNSGTITGNVELVANFEPVEVATYNVTAVSQPAGVATFEGTLSDVEDGTGYNVAISSVDEGYVFVEWAVEPNGIIDGTDVQVVAVFEEVVEISNDEDILDEVVAEDITDEELPEAGGIPTLGFSGLGLAIAAIGKKLQKR